MGIGLQRACASSLEDASRGRSAGSPPPDHVIQRVRRDYDTAFEALDRRQRQELTRACVRREAIDDRYILRDALRALAELWGLTGANAAAQRRLKAWIDKDAKPVVREDMYGPGE